MSSTMADLQRLLNRLDGKGYPAYKDIRGNYNFKYFTLFIDHVQGDPFAAPSRLRVALPLSLAGFPPATWANRSRQVALRDFLARRFSSQCQSCLAHRSRYTRLMRFLTLACSVALVVGRRRVFITRVSMSV